MKAAFAVLFVIMGNLVSGQDLKTLFETSGGTQTPTYFQIIDFYKRLDKASSKLLVKEMGMSDAGFRLHLALFSNDGKPDPARWRKQNKVILLINNGIHPGEPDGIDASMLLLRDLVIGKKTIPDNIALAFIPVYNIGGSLNRSVHYRVNQNGPEESGFRGNSQNLDLNRDFIKSDSREARSFAQLFHWVDPDILVDNHVSNGADYQHVMTLIASQHNKLGGRMGEYMNSQFEPGLYDLMKKKGYDLVPYVNFHVGSPEAGWTAFFDSPRYSSGYAALWNCFGFITETHMLKPYDTRVASTYAMMESFIEYGSAQQEMIKSLRRQARMQVRVQPAFDIAWQADSSQPSQVVFRGFEAGTKPSAVSGMPRLYYDRSKPFEKKIPFYNDYKPAVTVRKPLAYIIPAGWWEIINLLKNNGVEMQPFRKDTAVAVEVYRIEGYRSLQAPYEKHHMNQDVQVSASRDSLTFRKGDYYIPMNQEANRFLAEVLEPQATDSYFAWNFFDAIMGQKEGYSDYAFEDSAEGYLKDHPELRAALDAEKARDSAFARNGGAQLDFVYRHSPYMEPAYLRYPVYRVVR